MPQGGIDEGEDPRVAALRELREETGIISAGIIGESRDWYTYDLPPELLGKAWGGRFRGQKQKWFAVRFTGVDSEIDITRPRGGVRGLAMDCAGGSDGHDRAVQAVGLPPSRAGLRRSCPGAAARRSLTKIAKFGTARQKSAAAVTCPSISCCSIPG
jgi:hypothetical protein